MKSARSNAAVLPYLARAAAGAEKCTGYLKVSRAPALNSTSLVTSMPYTPGLGCMVTRIESRPELAKSWAGNSSSANTVLSGGAWRITIVRGVPARKTTTVSLGGVPDASSTKSCCSGSVAIMTTPPGAGAPLARAALPPQPNSKHSIAAPMARNGVNLTNRTRVMKRSFAPLR